MRLGFLGGSFDPPHVAHVELARLALASGQVEEVIVVPVFAHAFEKRSWASFDERLALCEAAFGAIAGVSISPLERDLPRPSYTIHSVRALLALRPGSEIRLLVGADVVQELHRWHEATALLKLAPPLAFARPRSAALPGALPGLPEVSSTEIRELLAKSARGASSAQDDTYLGRSVPAAVLAEIRRRGLYREEAATWT